jgi:uncharacterized Zn finger protein
MKPKKPYHNCDVCNESKPSLGNLGKYAAIKGSYACRDCFDKYKLTWPMNNPSNYDTENCLPELKDQVLNCPCCGHLVIMGLPHPDFNSNKLIVSEYELYRLSSVG